MKKLPYFPFYPSEWLRSPTTMGMTLAEQGAYLKLLCVQWEDGFIDPEDVTMILAMEDEEVATMMAKRVWRKAFSIGKDGMLRNGRLALERDSAAHKVESASLAAQKRWDKHKAAGSPVKKRRNAATELSAAIDSYSSEHSDVLPSSLVNAMEAYMKSRQQEGHPVWIASKWLRNLADEFTFAEWTEAYTLGARAGWKSLYPKKNDGAKKKDNTALSNLAAWSTKDDISPY